MAQFERGNKAAVGKGRPRKAEKFARPIAAAEKRISEWLPELIDKQMELARAGDRGAIEYLLNRLMGKPTERQELEAAIGSYVVDLSETDDSSTDTD
jgi:hypothetical protein